MLQKLLQDNITPGLYAMCNGFHWAITVFIQIEAWTYISYKRFLTQHVYKPFLRLTQMALNPCIYISPAFIWMNREIFLMVLCQGHRFLYIIWPLTVAGCHEIHGLTDKDDALICDHCHCIPYGGLILREENFCSFCRFTKNCQRFCFVNTKEILDYSNEMEDLQSQKVYFHSLFSVFCHHNHSQ